MASSFSGLLMKLNSYLITFALLLCALVLSCPILTYRDGPLQIRQSSGTFITCKCFFTFGLCMIILVGSGFCKNFFYLLKHKTCIVHVESTCLFFFIVPFPLMVLFSTVQEHYFFGKLPNPIAPSNCPRSNVLSLNVAICVFNYMYCS